MSSVRLAELMAAWSTAIDLAMVTPVESGLQICLIATGLAHRVGADPDELRRTYYLALLRHIGCTAANHEFAELVGDELAFREGVGGRDVTSKAALGPYLLRVAVGSRPLLERPAALGRFVRNTSKLKEAGEAVCEVGQMLIDHLGLGAGLREDLVLVYERYDGKGFPDGVPGDAITLPAALVQLAEAVTVHHRLGGATAVREMLGQRRGKALRPDLVDAFLADDELLPSADASLWDAVMAIEPGTITHLSEDELDHALEAFGDFVDLKSRFTAGHSSQVAQLAGDAGTACGMSAAEVRDLRRAGWLHDIGRLSVSVSVWDKPAALSRDEWERVRLHPYYTERVLSRPSALAALGALAGQHHERTDGTGYHRGQSRPAPMGAVLAAADTYAAMTSLRPHRAALSPPEAAQLLQQEVQSGHLAADAVAAVLQAAGQPIKRRQVRVAGLTPREVEVLRLLATGGSTKQIASALVVSPRTVEHHIESIYAKAEVKTRSAATLFALQHGLVETARS